MAAFVHVCSPTATRLDMQPSKLDNENEDEDEHDSERRIGRGQWSLPPPIEKLGEAAADPARVDGRFAERDAGAGWSDKVSDHDAQNQTGARDRDQSD
jgi:hypothetical protein